MTGEDYRFTTVEDYFEMCKRYWIVMKCDEAEASYRALWWDCKEVWDYYKTWNEESKKFFEDMKAKFPYREEFD